MWPVTGITLAAWFWSRAVCTERAPPPDRWIRVVAPDFECGLRIRNGYVADGGPSLRFLNGLSETCVRGHARTHGWLVEETGTR